MKYISELKLRTIITLKLAQIYFQERYDKDLRNRFASELMKYLKS